MLTSTTQSLTQPHINLSLSLSHTHTHTYTQNQSQNLRLDFSFPSPCFALSNVKRKITFHLFFINFTPKPGCLIPYMIVTYFYGGALVKKKKIQPKQDPNHRIYTIITIKSSSYVLNSFCLDILRLLSYSIVK